MEDIINQNSGESDYNLHDALVHSMYDLVDSPDAWPVALEKLDAILQLEANDSYSQELSSFIPHAERVSLLIKQLEQLELKQHQTDGLINNIPMGIVFMHTDGKIISANKRAVEILQNSEIRQNSKYLIFDQPQIQSLFIESTHKVHTDQHHGKIVKADKLHMWITSYNRSAKEVVIFLSDHTLKRFVCSHSLQEVYKLTIKESLVTCELCHGLTSLEDVANTLDITVATARTHLKKVFAKTGVCSQAELIKTIMLNPSLMLDKEQGGITNRDCLLARLPSGRSLSYAEYGDPSGRPVILCHAMSGCRLMVPDNIRLLLHHRIRLVVPDRAGYGQSTATNKDIMEQWLEDGRFFIKLLGIKGCDLIGHSGGGPHAMALAADSPDLVRQLYLISSISPIQSNADIKTLLPVIHMAVHLCRKRPKVAHAFIKMSLRTLAGNPESYFKHVMEKLPELDRSTLGNDNLKSRLIKGFEETRCQGVDHIVNEVMYMCNQWQIDPKQIHCPVYIWHGSEDSHAPFSMMQNLADKLPACRSKTWLPGHGHYLLFSHWEEIIQQLAENLNSPLAS